MKNLFSIISVLFLCTTITVKLSAQEAPKKIETREFPVSGVCQMCEKRIEKAALIPGVMSASWDKDSQKVTVIYKPKKTGLEDIKKAIAAVGHDTDTIKAVDEVYKTLPDCCAYRDGVKVH